MKRAPEDDEKRRLAAGIDYLLSFDGQEWEIDAMRHRLKVEVKRCAVTAARPSGIRYSLTLHTPDGLRLMGFDNAHGGITPVGSAYKFAGQRFRFDHRHRFPGDPGVFYEFDTGFKLFEDFWNEVNRVLKELSP